MKQNLYQPPPPPRQQILLDRISDFGHGKREFFVGVLVVADP